MVRRRRVALAILLPWLALPGAALGGGLAQLKAFVEGTRSAEARFAQTVTARSGSRPQQASGSMAFVRPGKFRWTYDSPYYQLIVGDGEKLWVYDRDLNQVTVKRLGEALGATPAALLAGDNALERNFVLSEAAAADGLEWVDAVPRNREGGFERLRLGFAGGELRRMELVDAFGQTTLLSFSAMRRNPPLDAREFRFTPPAGADVVGD